MNNFKEITNKQKGESGIIVTNDLTKQNRQLLGLPRVLIGVM